MFQVNAINNINAMLAQATSSIRNENDSLLAGKACTVLQYCYLSIIITTARFQRDGSKNRGNKEAADAYFRAGKQVRNSQSSTNLNFIMKFGNFRNNPSFVFKENFHKFY